MHKFRYGRGHLSLPGGLRGALAADRDSATRNQFINTPYQGSPMMNWPS